MKMQESKMTYLLTWGLGPEEVKYHLGNHVWGGIHLPSMASSSLLLWINENNLAQIFPLFCRGPTKDCQTFDAFQVFLSFWPTLRPSPLYLNLFVSPFDQKSLSHFLNYFSIWSKAILRVSSNSMSWSIHPWNSSLSVMNCWAICNDGIWIL